MAAKPKWSDLENEFIVTNYLKISNREIGRRLDRSPGAVSQQALKLGLKSNRRILILSGMKFNKLTALEFSHKTKGFQYWKFKCECGKESLTRANDVAGGRIISCGCFAAEQYKLKHGLPEGEALARELYSTYRRNALDRNLHFLINEEQFFDLIKRDCYICGIKPSQSGRINRRHNAGNFKYNGIDRFDNNVGYVMENCKPCCGTCNMAKRNLSHEEFFSWIERIGENYVSKIKSFE